MIILSQGSYKGSRLYNADIVGNDKNMYYVCDGSTAVFDDYKFYETGDLLEYMTLLHKNIKDSNSLSNSFKEAIKLSNAEYADMSSYKEWELPTYTIGAIKEKEDTIEYYLLCDILISVLYKDGHVENIEDKRMSSITSVFLDRVREINNDNSLTDIEKEKLLIENEQLTRMKVNQDGTGFVVGSTRLESIDAGYVGVLDKKLVDKILICSDGYYYSENLIPKSREDFELVNIEKVVKEKLLQEKRDDMSYILLQNI